ncbi:hypothetical protein I3843_11G192200 [Carya illinoinensis]|uniref:Receptor-like serine/threonine-protein kinase n=2 Tax=Carya illinoinensis TaxID=32201 RepID=A0A8T1PA86_CARIL|nr:G-type lectin S-receptor-like serine/threonine-protein kinase At1g11300 isoform X2 [Carya illinoinensis]KAG6637710.1 hypothetical protein CIPAW_11G197300 [Carya illinoinensis]KAG7957771.1 hypothetical protein I3843_11G192200 [Carya illinoinensis]
MAKLPFPNMSRRISPFIPTLLLLFCLGLQLANGSVTDTIGPGQSLTTSETIVSAKGKFELGFFSPANSTRNYVGIWYKKDPNRTVVWVANRERPFPNSSAVLTLNPDGNLVISGGIMQYMVANTSSGNDTYAMLLDTGNLRVIKRVSDVVLWESFEHPTDTLLPGMKVSDVTKGWSLTSWKSTEDPAPGLFSMHLGSWNGGSWKELIVMKGSETYWSSAFIGLLNDILVIDGESVTWRSKYTDKMLRIVLDVTGQFRLLESKEDGLSWHSLPSPKCGAYALCGAYSICSETTDRRCDCLPGFKQVVAEGNKSSGLGCVRKIDLKCGNDTKFSPLPQVDWPRNPKKLDISDSVECMSACSTDCSCIAYAYDHRKHECLVWEGPLLNVKQLSEDDGYGNDFYLKLDPSESITKGNGTVTSPGHKNTKVAGLLWAIIIPTVSFALVFSLLVYCARRKKELKRKGDNLLLLDLTIESNSSELTESSRHGDSRRGKVKMPLFSFASVSAATGNFSPGNKLGEGGFGPVYKGTLQRGDVAVKRLSRKSGQGWEELKNEAMLIATLQHKNLVRLLGCCIEGDEKILVYEYMPNKSLDFFIFDAEKRKILDWGKRIQIIQGVAQGLLYLHQYSRLRIIHRDLKASNILLDTDMNPKISDFGMARIFGGNESEANTNRIVGTQGYMSPEYLMQGVFSIKSDVFSFGVLLLEILSGRKNTGHLLGYAWELWSTEKGSDIVDPLLLDDMCSMSVVLRCINIALLCVQESAADRPTMSDVVAMLSNDSKVLPYPNQPGLMFVRSMVKAIPISGVSDFSYLKNETVSIVEGR